MLIESGVKTSSLATVMTAEPRHKSILKKGQLYLDQPHLNSDIRNSFTLNITESLPPLTKPLQFSAVNLKGHVKIALLIYIKPMTHPEIETFFNGANSLKTTTQ